MIRWDRTQMRVWIARRRIHHGFPSALLIAIGLLGAYHDRADWREWFRFTKDF